MNGLKLVLDRLGLKQSEFAKLLDVSPRAVSLWATGEVTLPGPVRAYLRMLQHAEPPVRSAELARLSSPRPAFKDGLYSLMYGTSSGSDKIDKNGVLRYSGVAASLVPTQAAPNSRGHINLTVRDRPITSMSGSAFLPQENWPRGSMQVKQARWSKSSLTSTTPIP
jgi:hypothetical protein